MMFVTSLDHPEYSETYNKYDGYRHPVILHQDFNYHLGRFPTMEKLKEFMDFAGLTLGELTDEKDMGKAGTYRQWKVYPSETKQEPFTTMRDIPDNAKPFTGLSNGSLVTCYLYNDGEILHIYRPNPNNKTIYKSLSVEEHRKFCRENGYV